VKNVKTFLFIIAKQFVFKTGWYSYGYGDVR